MSFSPGLAFRSAPGHASADMKLSTGEIGPFEAHHLAASQTVIEEQVELVQSIKPTMKTGIMKISSGKYSVVI